MVDLNSPEYDNLHLRIDRYGGTYSGGRWVCSVGNNVWAIEAGDVECSNFWYECYERTRRLEEGVAVGVGETPEEAVIMAFKSVETGFAEIKEKPIWVRGHRG